MKKKILITAAHPDDEVFGPGGTIAKYAKEGTEIHLLCATRGERGGKGSIREKELLKSAEVLGIKKVEVLDFIDGELGNAIYHDLAGKITSKIKSFKPQVVLTMERRGISGHLDHIAVSMITTYSFLNCPNPRKLYYLCLPQKYYDEKLTEYFIYFPEGYSEKEITTRIDFAPYYDIKKKAMLEHKSQMEDVVRLIKRYDKWPKTDHFILHKSRTEKAILPETDLFANLT